MFLTLSGVLDAGQLATATELAATLRWVDGAATAGPAARAVKHNEQADLSSRTGAKLRDMLGEAIRAHPVLAAAAQPRRFSSLLVSRTQDGGAYGLHVDNPFMGTGDARLRTDLSFTLFLSEPDSYEGGELEIHHAGNTHHAKAAAGDLILYPSTSLHQVRPVTSGQRIVCAGWIESSIRDAAAREILFDLENLRATLGQTHDVRSPEYLTLSKSIANLMRLWGEA